MKIKVINKIGQKFFNAAGCFPWVNKIVNFLYQRICLFYHSALRGILGGGVFGAFCLLLDPSAAILILLKLLRIYYHHTTQNFTIFILALNALMSFQDCLLTVLLIPLTICINKHKLARESQILLLTFRNAL